MTTNDRRFEQLHDLTQSLLINNGKSKRSQSNVTTLLHELQHYQTELEKQNNQLKQDQVEMRATKDSFREYFNVAPICYFVLDADCVILQTNLTAEAKFAVTPDALLGLDFTELMTVSQRDKYHSRYQTLLQNHQPYQTETWLSWDGSDAFYGCVESLILDEADNVNNVFITVTDITDRKTQENNIKSLFHLDQSIFDGQSVKQIINEAVRTLNETLPYDDVALILFNDANNIALEYRQEKDNDASKRRIISLDLLERLTSLDEDDTLVIENPAFLSQEILKQCPQHLFAPVFQDDQLKGVIDFGLSATSTLDQFQVKVARQLARELGVVLYQAQLSEQIQLHTSSLHQRVDEQSVQLQKSHLREQDERLFAQVMLSMVKELNQTLDLRRVLEHILEHLKRILNYDSARIVILENDQIDVIVQRQGISGPLFTRNDEKKLSVEQFPTYVRMRQTRETVLLNDLGKASAKWIKDSQVDIKSYLGVPIISGDDILGFIDIYKLNVGLFSQKDVEHLEAFAEHASIAVKNARLYQQAQELSALEERQRIAHDLHDAVSQLIFSLCITAESQARMIEKGQYEQVKELSEIIRMSASHVHDEMNLLLMELRPITLSKTPLETLIKQLVTLSLGRYANVALDLVVEKLPPISIEAKNALFRITQELLSNIVKHAQAHNVRVTLHSMGKALHLSIEDDGLGFDLNSVTRGRGLHIIHERAKQIGADLKIHSGNGSGTQINVVFQPHIFINE